MIKHIHNQWVKNNFETKICLKIYASTSSADREK